MLKIILSFISGLFGKIIGENLKNLSITAIFALIGGSITYFINSMHSFFENHLDVFIFVFWATFSFSIYFLFLVIKMAINEINNAKDKKIVNSIAVDKDGDCFCPSCSKPLLIIRHPDYVGTKTFHCANCKNLLPVILENGKHVWPYYFANYQKQNPQSVLTQQKFNEHVQQSYKDAGLT